MDNLKQSAGKSAFFLTVMGLLSQSVAFFYRVALSRRVGAEIMGLYQLLMPVYSVLVALTAVGVTAATAHLTALFLAKKSHREVEATIWFSLLLFGLCLLPVTVVVLLFSDAISVNLLGDARTQLGLIFLLPCVALTGIENIHKHYFYGAGLVKEPSLTEFLEQFVRTAAVLGLLTFLAPKSPEQQVGIIVVGMVVCEVFSATSLVALYRRERATWRDATPKQKPSREVLAKIGKIALPVGAAALLGTLMGAANAALIPRLLVEGGMAREVAMASFGVLCGMTLPMLGLPTVLLTALNLVLIPRQARSYALGRWDEIRRRTNKALLAVSASMLPAMALLAVIGGDLGVMLFQNEQVGSYLLPLALASAFSSYQSTLFALLNGIGRQSICASLSLFAGGTQLLFTLVIVPRFGLSGFVYGLLFLSGFHTILQCVIMLKLTKTPLNLFAWLTAPALSATLMGLCANLLYRAMEDAGVETLITLVVVTVFSIVLYSVCMICQGVSFEALLGKTGRT
ncbi:MAG: oligosaccharide flippase family protein [Eubacteriales bacterium]